MGCISLELIEISLVDLFKCTGIVLIVSLLLCLAKSSKVPWNIHSLGILVRNSGLLLLGAVNSLQS